MPVYFGEFGITTVRTDTVGVHRLPANWNIITGIAAPAAAAGPKTFAGIARCRTDTLVVVGYDRRLVGTLNCRCTAICELSTGRATLDAVLKCKTTALSCKLTTYVPTTITYVGAGTLGAILSSTLSLTAPTHNVGDLLLAIVSGGSTGWGSVTTGWLNPPSGAFNGSNQGGAVNRTVFYKFADGSANDNLSVTPVNSNATNPNYGRIFAYRGVHTGTPFGTRVLSLTNVGFYWTLGGVSGGGTGLHNIQVVAGVDTAADIGLVYGLFLYVKAHVLTFMVYGDEQLVATPTFTNDATMPNSAVEVASFPHTLDAIAGTSLGVGGGLAAFRWPNPGLEYDGYSAGGLQSSNTAVSVNHFVLTTALTPAGVNINVAVTLDGLLKCKATATCNLTRVSGANNVNLAGSLTCKSTVSCVLDQRPGVFVAAILRCKVSLFGDLTAPHPFDLYVRCRCVAVATAFIGIHHRLNGSAQCRSTAVATLTTNYMLGRLRCKASIILCDLLVNLKLVGAMTCRATGTAALTVGRTYAAVAQCRTTATCRLFAPLRGSAQCRASAACTLVVQRRLAGSTAAHATASLALSVVRTLGASVGAHCTASATLTSIRSLAAFLRCRCTASVAFTSDRWLAAFLRCRCTALLDLVPLRAIHPPTTDITVSPYMEVADSDSLPVRVESPDGTVHVEVA